MTVPSQHMTLRVRISGDLVPCRFDYPQTSGEPFLFSIPKSYSGNDWEVLKHVLNGRKGRAHVVRGPVDEELAGFKVYDISNYIPAFVYERLGKDSDVPGPNCYQAALAALDFADLRGRHVDPVEAGFYFSRFFEEVDEVRHDAALGDIRIYHEKSRMPVAAAGFADVEEPEPALVDIMERAQDMPPAIGASCVHMFNMEEDPEWIGTVFSEVPDLSDEGVAALREMTTIASLASTAEAEMFEARAELETLEAEAEALDEEIASLGEELRAAGVELAAAAEAAEGEAEVVGTPATVAEYVPEIKPGVHAALVLLGGLVFQRGGWDENHVDMIVPAKEAMSSIEVIIRDPFYPPATNDDDDFTSRAIRILMPEELAARKDEQVRDEKLSAAIAAYLPVVEHYTQRLGAVANLQWDEFARNRVDLLSMENLWTILDDMEQRLKAEGMGMIRALQLIDDKIATAYLKLRSLRWQYQAMVNRYDSPGRIDSASKKQRRLRKLYQRHYINPESNAFRNEIEAYLRMRNVEPEKWAGIIEFMITRMKAIDPVKLVKGYGADQVDFFSILNRAIANS